MDIYLPVSSLINYSGGRLIVSRAGSVFDANGELVDAAMREQIQKYLEGFTAFVKARKGKK